MDYPSGKYEEKYKDYVLKFRSDKDLWKVRVLWMISDIAYVTGYEAAVSKSNTKELLGDYAALYKKFERPEGWKKQAALRITGQLFRTLKSNDGVISQSQAGRLAGQWEVYVKFLKGILDKKDIAQLFDSDFLSRVVGNTLFDQGEVGQSVSMGHGKHRSHKESRRKARDNTQKNIDEFMDPKCTKASPFNESTLIYFTLLFFRNEVMKWKTYRELTEFINYMVNAEIIKGVMFKEVICDEQSMRMSCKRIGLLPRRI